MKKITLIIILFMSRLDPISHAPHKKTAKKTFISKSIVPLRIYPLKNITKPLTELLCGDKVIIKKEFRDWYYVEICKQKTTRPKNWYQNDLYTQLDLNNAQPLRKCSGWVLKEETLDQPQNKVIKNSNELRNKKIIRSHLIEAADQLLMIPYTWYGASTESLSCSGLTYLTYKMCNIIIPRYAQDQYLAGKPIDGKDVQPGDLVFYSSEKNHKKIVHVMLYVAENTIIEATQSEGNKYSRLWSASDRIGAEIKSVNNGDIINERAIYFCTYLK